MAAKRQLELYLLRFLPHALRDDFVTVGLLLLESDGGFAEVRLTRDWKMLQCVAPDVELEWFATVENEIQGRLASLRRRDDLLQLVNERFGTMLDVASAKAVLTEDPAKEMEVLASMYLVPLERGEGVTRRSGRAAIVQTMREAFETAGVLELMQHDLNVARYTGLAGDPFRVDFGYRLGNALKTFQAVSLVANANQPQALGLAYRYPRLEAGMRMENIQTSMTALVDVANENTMFAIAALELASVQVRRMGELAEIAGEASRDLLG